MIDTRRAKFMMTIENHTSDLLGDYNCKSFVGGSRRFKTDTEESDIDFMVLLPADWRQQTSLYIMLRQMGFIKNITEYTETTSSVWTLGKLLHLSLFTSEFSYDALAQEHVTIEKALHKNTLMKDFLISLKTNTTLSGAIIYRILRNTVLVHEATR